VSTWSGGRGRPHGSGRIAREARRATEAVGRLGEDRLAARAAAGDEAAYAEIFRRYHQPLFRYSLALLHDPEDAADVLQTTMAKSLAALEGGETVKGLRPWLFRIAHNAAVDLVRRRRPQAPIDELAEIESSHLTAPSAATEVEGKAELAEAVADIQSLPPRQQGALVMRELSSLAYPEIAAALATSQPAARQLVHQARNALHERRSGRDMDCEPVRQAISDRDGRAPRERRLRAHLAVCADCQGFQASIRRRRTALAALVPPLAPAAASDILTRLFEGGSHQGAGLAAGSVAAGGGLAKLAGVSTATKVAAAAATGAVVVAAGGGLVAAGGLLEAVDERRGPGAADEAGVPSFLRPDMPELRPLPRPSERAGGGQRGGEQSAGTEGSADSATASPPLAALAAAPAAGRGPVSRPNGVTVPDGRGPVELAGPVSSPVDGGGGGGLSPIGGGSPGVELPDVGGGPGVDLPGVDLPGVDVDIPPVRVPDVQVPTVPVTVPQTSVTLPEVPTGVPSAPVPAGSPSLPSVGASAASGAGTSSSVSSAGGSGASGAGSSSSASSGGGSASSGAAAGAGAD
jgi:RNA polymerase sigma factor (sigma-70 family)